jgi:4-amino-4-deoxychorismate lyase
MEWFRDGRQVQSLPLDDRGLHYGDGLFETVAIRRGRPRLWDYHVERLQSGCERLAVPAPSRQSLERQFDAAVEAAGLDTARCVAKIIVTAGAATRGYKRPEKIDPTVLIGMSASTPLPASRYETGVDIRICETRLAVQPQLAGIKSLNRLEQVIARNEWRDGAEFEGLLLDTDERVICGTMSNVFLLNGNSAVTAAITRCGVAGVMRRHVLALMDEAGIECAVRDIGREEIEACDGMLISNSQFGVLPVRRCEGTRFGRNELAARLLELVTDSGIREYAA